MYDQKNRTQNGCWILITGLFQPGRTFTCLGMGVVKRTFMGDAAGRGLYKENMPSL